MGTLTATPDTANGRVLITVTGAQTGDTITRDGDPVRYPPLTGPTALVYDYEARPGQTHTWELSSGGSDTAALPEGDCDGAWLVHPTDPDLSQKVKVRVDRDWTWRMPGTIHEVIGNRPPLYTHTVRTFHSGTIEWWTPLDKARDMVDLFADGAPILVNPPVCCASLDRQWIAGDLAASWVGDNPTGRSGIWWQVNYTSVQQPGGYITRPGSVANSWAGVLAEPSEATWADLQTQHATWADVVATAHPHGATP